MHPDRDSLRFKFIVPPIEVGANKVMADLFNATTVPLYVRGIELIPNRDTAVVGVVSTRYSLTRTTAVGTGGTAAVVNTVNPLVPALAELSGSETIPAGVTARSAPSGGATAGAVLGTRQVFTEETSPASTDKAFAVINDYREVCTIPPGTGIRIVQGTVAGVGSVGIEVLLGL